MVSLCIFCLVSDLPCAHSNPLSFVLPYPPPPHLHPTLLDHPVPHPDPQIDPHCAPVYCNIGNVYLRKHSESGDPDHLQRVLDNCTKALQIDDKAFHAQVFMGEACLRLGREGEGLKHLYDALRLSPSFPGAHSILGAFFAGQNRLTEVSLPSPPCPSPSHHCCMVEHVH